MAPPCKLFSVSSLLCKSHLSKQKKNTGEGEKKWGNSSIWFSQITKGKDLHCHAKEFMFGCGDDNVGRAQSSEIIILAGQVPPVQDGRSQHLPGL